MQNKITLLKEIRQSPRKMQVKYLQSVGLYDFINSSVNNEFSIKEKIDIILKDSYNKCHCGVLAKANSKWCSITCRNKDINIRKSISKKNTANAPERMKLMKETLKKEYGVFAIQNIPSVKEKMKAVKQSYYDKVIKNTFLSYNIDINEKSNHDYLNKICKDSSYPDISVRYFGGMPVMTIMRHFNRIGFDPKFDKSSSSGEKQIAFYIESLGFSIERNTRRIISPKELDIYIPSKSLAIEYHGLYWHMNDNNSHNEKRIKCENSGIQLLQFYEDEWIQKSPIIKSMISSKLGLNEKIYARNTTVHFVLGKAARSFLEQNHIQGSVNGKHLGLFYNGNLVAIMTVGKNRFKKGIELLRYCTLLHTTVVGGFSKLLKAVRETFRYNNITTYADLRYSDGHTYEKFGTLSHITPPGYYWVDKNKSKRINRMATQKHKLHHLLGDKFDASKSETENMESCGYQKIWDCGQKVFILA